MAQWGKNDVNSNSVLWGVTGFNKAPTSTNRDNFYNNITPEYYENNGVAMKMTAGQFGVSTAEAGVGSGEVAQVTITNAGTGYNGTVLSTISGGGGSSANVTFSQVDGRITGYTIVNAGSSYETNPTLTIQAPALRIFNGNTAITSNSSIGAFIAYASANDIFLAGDQVTFAGNATSLPVGLTDTGTYFISFANTSGWKLSTTINGANINFTPASGNNITAGGATLQGVTATAAAVVGGGSNKGVAHAGWVVRTVGTGGRAGRVQYETLVAMGTITGDGSDDSILPDS